MKDEYIFGLVGHNVSYSRSLDIFNSIFKIKNLNGHFELYDFSPSQFNDKFPQLKNENIDGLSITIPYKRKVIEYLSDIDPVAKALDAVNSILVKENHFYGFNTDAYGFSLPLRKYHNRLKHGNAIIFGAGGAAKAVIYSLYTDYELANYYILGRDETKLSHFKESLKKQINNININFVTYEHYSQISNISYDIVVNCTPAGGWNFPEKSPIPDNFNWLTGKIYYDLNYNDHNIIIQMANEHSLIAIDGSTMLVGQAVRSFYLWTGIKVSIEEVYKSVFTHQ
ncbi:MAG: shikimate dehydrogenase [FCB group bacterium]|nr:shikimate dehydrogenase [FCB group bacterium]